MRDDNFEKHKATLLEAVGKVVRTFRNKGVQLFAYERDLSPITLMSIEKGRNDARISTLYKIANALGLSFPEFIDLVQKELPEGFSMLDE